MSRAQGQSPARVLRGVSTSLRRCCFPPRAGIGSEEQSEVEGSRFPSGAVLGWVNEDGWMDGWMDGWVGGWMDGRWMEDGWKMDGWEQLVGMGLDKFSVLAPGTELRGCLWG